MLISLRQEVFFVGLSFFLLLLLILGESHLNFVLLGAGSLFLLAFFKELRWPKLGSHQLLVVFWLLFFIALLVSSFFTISIPLTLGMLAEYSWIGVWFLFWVLVDDKFAPTKLVIKLFLLLGLVMVIISTLFFIFPNMSKLLPGMNLVYATYGHNHLAALLLLIIPFSWQQALTQIRINTKNKRVLLLPLVFSISLFFSFGRLATVLGFGQLLVIGWHIVASERRKKQQLLPPWVKVFFKLIVGFFALVLISELFFSIVPISKQSFPCTEGSLKKQLCKSIVTEARPLYWERSFRVIQKYSLWGGGPGTYSISYREYQQTPDNASAYVHNAFLQEFSESGLVGGTIFVILMSILLWQLIESAKKSSDDSEFISLEFSALLAVGSMYIDVLFDFDWNFIGIFTITILLLALFIKKKQRVRKNFSYTRVIKLVYVSLSLYLITMAGLYFTTEYFITSDQTDKAFEVFPYFYWHRKIYEDEFKLDNDRREQLLNIYADHSDIYLSYLIYSNDLDEKQKLKEKLVVLDPWQRLNNDVIGFYLDNNELDRAEKEAVLTSNLVKEGFERYQYMPSHSFMSNFSQQLLTMADKFYADEQTAKAARYYLDAQFFREWALGEHRPIFLDLNQPNDLVLGFFRQLNGVPSEYFGQYKSDYSQKYLEAVLISLDQAEAANITLDIKRIIEIDSDRRWKIWKEINELLISKSQEYMGKLSFVEAQKTVDQLFSIQEILGDQNYYLSWTNKKNLAQILLDLSDFYEVMDPSRAVTNHSRAMLLIP